MPDDHRVGIHRLCAFHRRPILHGSHVQHIWMHHHHSERRPVRITRHQSLLLRHHITHRRALCPLRSAFVIASPSPPHPISRHPPPLCSPGPNRHSHCYLTDVGSAVFLLLRLVAMASRRLDLLIRCSASISLPGPRALFLLRPTTLFFVRSTLLCCYRMGSHRIAPHRGVGQPRSPFPSLFSLRRMAVCWPPPVSLRRVF